MKKDTEKQVSDVKKNSFLQIEYDPIDDLKKVQQQKKGQQYINHSKTPPIKDIVSYDKFVIENVRILKRPLNDSQNGKKKPPSFLLTFRIF